MNNFTTKLLLLIAFTLSVGSVRAEVTEIDNEGDIRYNNRPIVIEAYASWCAPCRAYSPIFERLSREYAGKVDFYKVNVDNPEAEDFIIRYEVNSVPLTVFLWDPQGDATVKHSVERGLMNYSELKTYIEQTLRKQFKQQAFSTNGSLTWSSGHSEDSFVAYVEAVPQLSALVGEWEGIENGYPSKVLIFKEGSEIQYIGGVLDPGRYALVGTPWWISLGFEWDEANHAAVSCDVLPLKPTSPFQIHNSKNGTFRERSFTLVGGNLCMRVNEFAVNDGHSATNPTRSYEVRYKRVNNL